mgnify:FL=1
MDITNTINQTFEDLKHASEAEYAILTKQLFFQVSRGGTDGTLALLKGILTKTFPVGCTQYLDATTLTVMNSHQLQFMAASLKVPSELKKQLKDYIYRLKADVEKNRKLK